MVLDPTVKGWTSQIGPSSMDQIRHGYRYAFTEKVSVHTVLVKSFKNVFLRIAHFTMHTDQIWSMFFCFKRCSGLGYLG
jgi:hypothetical protein